MPQNLMSLAACDRSICARACAATESIADSPPPLVAPPGTALSWLAFTVDFSACVAPSVRR